MKKNIHPVAKKLGYKSNEDFYNDYPTQEAYEMKFGGSVEKTPKKIMNKIMPIEALNGNQVPPGMPNPTNLKRNPGYNSWGATPVSGSTDNGMIGPMPDMIPLQGTSQQGIATMPYSTQMGPFPMDGTNNTGITQVSNQSQVPNETIDDEGGYFRKHPITVNGHIDIPNGIKNGINLTAGIIQDTKKKGNKNMTAYGYNPQPNGSGTQAAYANGGIVGGEVLDQDTANSMANASNPYYKEVGNGMFQVDQFSGNWYHPNDTSGWEGYGNDANLLKPDSTGFAGLGNAGNTYTPQPIQNAQKQQGNWHTDESTEGDYSLNAVRAKNGMKVKKCDDGGDIYMWDDGEYPEEAAYGIQMRGPGSIQPISANPYSDSILEHKGESHDNGGIKQAQFGTKLETEGGETQYKNTILGNMYFPKIEGSEFEEFVGKKFKNIGKDLADEDNFALKKINKGDELMKADPTNKYKSLTHNSGVVYADAGSQYAKKATVKKEMVTQIQQGLLDLSEETGVEPEKMHTIFKNGGTIKAKGGYNFLPKDVQKKLKDKGWDGTTPPGQWVTQNLRGDAKKALGSRGIPKDALPDDYLGEKVYGPRWRGLNFNDIQPKQSTMQLPTTEPQMPSFPMNNSMPQVQPYTGNAELPAYVNDTTKPKGRVKSMADQNKLGFKDFMSEARYLLDQPDQVVSQQYNPQLLSPYQVSFQDRINRNDGTLRAVAQQAPNSMGALSVAAAQNYNANNEVAAEEFRTNQGIFNGVMNSNYSIMNEAQKMNMGMADQQMVRQAQAKSNTDAHKAQALASISDKISRNRYDNMNYHMVEQRSGFRYNPETKNMEWTGPDAYFNTNGGPSNYNNPYFDETQETDADGNVTKIIRKKKNQLATAKWGGMFPS